MRLGTRKTTVALMSAALLAATASCSTKAEDTSGTADPGASAGGEQVQTDIGVSGDTITLGVLTDLTGVFAALGKDITNANSLYWADKKVCDKYSVELDIKDTGYNPQQAVQLYSGMKDGVLSMQQTIGSPINTALGPEYIKDKIVNFPSAWAANLTDTVGTGVVGATYQVEISNAYDYLFEKGLLKEGDTVGHLYFEGEYGANGLAGSKAVAAKKGLKLIEAQIKPTDQDMTPQITQFKAAGVKAIALTTSPAQLASAAGVAGAQRLDVPLFGNNPIFSPALLAGPAAEKLKKDLYVASPISTFDKHEDLLKAYQDKYPGGTPSLGVLFGIGMSEIMNATLDSACEKGDLTRQGVLDAFNELSEPDTGGVIVPINGFKEGVSPSLQSFILRAADVPGGATVEKDAFQGEFAEELSQD